MRCQAASIENSVFGPGYQASQEQGLFSYGLLYSVFPLVQLGHGKKRENPSIWSFEPGFLIQTCVHSKSKACKRDKNCSIPCLDSYLRVRTLFESRVIAGVRQENKIRRSINHGRLLKSSRTFGFTSTDHTPLNGNQLKRALDWTMHDLRRGSPERDI
jgi:hypothetical protein